MINRTPTTLLNGKSPYEILFSSPSSYNHLRAFDCLCYAHNRPRVKDKFGPRSGSAYFWDILMAKRGGESMTWKLVICSSLVMLFFMNIFFLMQILLLIGGTNHDSAPSAPWVDDWDIGVSPSTEPIIIPHATDPLPDIVMPTLIGGVHESSSPQVDSSPPSSPPPPQSHPARDCRPSGYLDDYVCHTACIDFISSAPVQNGTSDTPYPLANFVTLNNFSKAHSQVLANITKGVEPKNFSEAV